MATTWISKIQSGDTAYNIALNSNVIDSSFTLDANQVLKHANSVTAATAYPSNATTASANGGQIIVRDVQYNAQGHITSSRDRTITLSQTTYTLSGLGGIGSANASGNAPLSLSATKSGTTLTITGSVAAATTSAAGVIKIDATNTNALLNTLTTGSSTPVDADYFISQYAGGGSTTTTYHRRPVSALWSYIDGKIQNAGYVKSSGVTSITITSGTGITVSDSGTAITGTGTRTITHYTPTGASSTTKGSSAARTYIKQISTDQFGHITGVTTGAETVTNTTYSAGDGITLTGTKFSIASTSVTNAMLQNSSISIAGSSVSLGGSVDAATLRQNLGLSSALRFLGTTTTTMSDGRTTATVAINNTNTTPTTGDVVIYGDGEYLWTGSAWELLGDAGSFKTVQTAITDSTGTAEATTATRFVYSVSQNANGVISVKTRPLPTYNNYSLPLAADGTRGGIQIGYSESGTNYAVKLSSEKAYVTVPWTDTKVTSVNNHYTPEANTNSELTASLSGTAGTYALNTEYTVLTGVKAQRDAKGHITGLTYTAQKIKDTNTTYTLAGLMGSTPKGSSTKPIYWTGSAFDTISSYEGQSAYVGKGSHSAAVTANEFAPPVGTATVVGNVSNTTMAHSNNANAEMVIKTHPTSGTSYYEARLGFSSDGNLYYMPVNAAAWKQVAYTDSNISGKAATAGVADSANSVAWTGITGKPTTIADYGITDAKISNGVITLGSNTITPITAHQAVSNKGATLAWSTTSTIATIGGTDIKVTMPANPNSDTKVTQAAAITNAGAYPIILAYSTATTAITNTVNKASTLTYNPSTKALSTGGTVNGYTLAAASAKAVDTSIAAASTSTNLPTSQAVASFVEGKGYSTTDTKNTAGATADTNKLFIIGAKTQDANPQTYSNSAVYEQAGTLAATTIKIAEQVSLVFNSTTNALDFVFA